jgi:transcriptional regulator with XRE-family HTH domain
MVYIGAVPDMGEKFKNLGEWLQHWRKQFGYTQLALGEAVGVSKQHISNLERRQQHATSGAESNASIELLDKLSRLFKRPIKEARILAGYEKANHIDTIEEALDSALFFDQKGLSEADRVKLRPLLEVADREIDRLKEKKGE